MKEAGTHINQRLINTFLLNSGFTDNLGLLNGKMGISISAIALPGIQNDANKKTRN